MVKNDKIRFFLFYTLAQQGFSTNQGSYPYYISINLLAYYHKWRPPNKLSILSTEIKKFGNLKVLKCSVSHLDSWVLVNNSRHFIFVFERDGLVSVKGCLSLCVKQL